MDRVLENIRKDKKSLSDLGLQPSDLEDIIAKGYDPTITQTGNLPKYVSSILKRSKNAEKYHSNDTVTRMLSYIDETAQLIKNKDVTDLVNKAHQSSPELGKYLGNTDSIVRTML